MDLTRTKLGGVVEIIPKRHQDSRGFFSEAFNLAAFTEAYGSSPRFVQDNMSLSRETGTLRGLHFQSPPRAQAKLVMVMAGSILDVAVDIRHGSPTFGQYFSVTLSASQGNQLFIPEGFAHGFCTLEPDTLIMYKVTDYYSPEHDKGVIWDDPQISIDWPSRNMRLSEKDQHLPSLKQLPEYFLVTSTT